MSVPWSWSGGSGRDQLTTLLSVPPWRSVCWLHAAAPPPSGPFTGAEASSGSFSPTHALPSSRSLVNPDPKLNVQPIPTISASLGLPPHPHRVAESLHRYSAAPTAGLASPLPRQRRRGGADEVNQAWPWWPPARLHSLADCVVPARRTADFEGPAAATPGRAVQRWDRDGTVAGTVGRGERRGAETEGR